MMTRPAAAALTVLLLSSCASYNHWQKAREAETNKNWDAAVIYYEKALHIDPSNSKYKLALERAKRESSRLHFEKGKSLRAALVSAHTLDEQIRLSRMAATELELTVKLDPTNQFAAVELGKTVQFLQDAANAELESKSIDEVKRRAKTITKAQPPVLNPASDEPISLSFPRETPVKDIYRALGNAFGINILFDQAVKDDRISIELRDVTAQQALERVMQAASHFYKVLDEKSIIVVPDNPQARRDYEDLVIQTFYLSNGDAEQVTNVVRTMIEARNVFPLKALNAITIRDTADKVRIAEKIIEANDKAKAEVVVAVELVQLDINKLRDIGFAVSGGSAMAATPFSGVDDEGARSTFTGGTLAEIAEILGSTDALRNNVTFTIPTATYSLVKTLGNSELLANPELRISEGEKATLHIGQRIPVPVSTFTTINTGGANPYQPSVSFQYQDVGIKVSMEPRVHHNREITLKLTVEVSNQGDPVTVEGFLPQPTFSTRTIESTIRLKDGETNFLAGLIQDATINSVTKTPFLGDIPFLGRLFTKTREDNRRTDLVLTMTPHIIRIPDITEDDVAPMWVGTTNNLTFRGVTPRIESQSGVDPFTQTRPTPPAAPFQIQGGQIVPAGTPVQTAPAAQQPGGFNPPQGGAPSDPFRPQPPPPPPQNPPQPQSNLAPSNPLTAVATAAAADVSDAAMRFAPRIAPQPASLSIGPGQQLMWTVVGMDLQGLVTDSVVLRYDPNALEIMDVSFGPAMLIDPRVPPVVTTDRPNGLIRIVSSDGKPLTFRSGGEVLILRVSGGTTGDTSLVLDIPELKNANGDVVVAAITGGRARVE
ncbi:MAG TPA: secretin N-terminal domain-containing protein [Thermoanaerobaculia bacterium]|nr:secretin N-terminal domain-containing protein [Thermoanaerobaculia bacterium]